MAVDVFSLIASAIGGALASKGADKAAAENQAGQEGAAKYALDESMPWDVAGSLGGVKFDSEGKVVGLGLSEDFQTQQKGFLTSADANRQYLQGLEGSPEDAAQRFYDQGMALRGPEQEVAREALDAQLANRGMLGSTGGAGQVAGLAQAQGNVNLQARQSSSDRVQDMIDRYRSRISGDVQGAASLGQMPLEYAKLGVDVGGMLSPAAQLGSRYLSGAAMTNANRTAGRYGGYNNALRSFTSYQQRQDNIARAGGRDTGNINYNRGATLGPGGSHQLW
jgi:hypothetical protein|tara:strand:- start:1505 stop:2341 length:837 start_codon:yes stop_codon:yes gene_type:complete